MTLWKAPTFEAAEQRAEAASAEYVSVVGGELLEFAQVYRLAEFPADGAEVFSLMRDSDLDADQYLSTFFDTGSEREGTIESE